MSALEVKYQVKTQNKYAFLPDEVDDGKKKKKKKKSASASEGSAEVATNAVSSTAPVEPSRIDPVLDFEELRPHEEDQQFSVPRDQKKKAKQAAKRAEAAVVAEPSAQHALSELEPSRRAVAQALIEMGFPQSKVVQTLIDLRETDPLLTLPLQEQAMMLTDRLSNDVTEEEPVVSTSSKAASKTVSAAASVSASVPAASKPAVVVSKAEVSTDVAASVVAPAAVAVAGEHGHVKFGQPANVDSDVTAPATKPAKKSALKASVSISTSEAVAEPAAAVATAPVEAIDSDDGGLHVWHSDLGQHSLFSNLGVKLLELWTHLLESGKDASFVRMYQNDNGSAWLLRRLLFDAARDHALTHSMSAADKKSHLTHTQTAQAVLVRMLTLPAARLSALSGDAAHVEGATVSAEHLKWSLDALRKFGSSRFDSHVDLENADGEESALCAALIAAVADSSARLHEPDMSGLPDLQSLARGHKSTATKPRSAMSPEEQAAHAAAAARSTSESAQALQDVNTRYASIGTPDEVESVAAAAAQRVTSLTVRAQRAAEAAGAEKTASAQRRKLLVDGGGAEQALKAARDAESAASSRVQKLVLRMIELEREMQEVGAQLKQAEAERDRRRDEVSSHGQRTGDEIRKLAELEVTANAAHSRHVRAQTAATAARSLVDEMYTRCRTHAKSKSAERDAIVNAQAREHLHRLREHVESQRDLQKLMRARVDFARSRLERAAADRAEMKRLGVPLPTDNEAVQWQRMLDADLSELEQQRARLKAAVEQLPALLGAFTRSSEYVAFVQAVSPSLTELHIAAPALPAAAVVTVIPTAPAVLSSADSIVTAPSVGNAVVPATFAPAVGAGRKNPSPATSPNVSSGNSAPGFKSTNLPPGLATVLRQSKGVESVQTLSTAAPTTAPVVVSTISTSAVPASVAAAAAAAVNALPTARLAAGRKLAPSVEALFADVMHR